MTDTSLHWLPERHLGVAATLSHTDDLISQIGNLLFDYQRQPGGLIGFREIPAGRHSQTVVDRVAPIPRKVPLLAADAMVALRAALEHTLYAEVEFLDGAPFEEKAAKLIEMPASETLAKFDEWKKKRVRHGSPSMQPTSDLVKRIEGLQPFHRRAQPQAHPLARLVLHTNHAKHRTPAVMAVRLAAMYREEQLPRSIKDLAPQPEEPIQIGDIIAETPLGIRVPVVLFPTVGINLPGTKQWPVLMNELEEIALWVRTQAVPRLITGAEPSNHILPAHYEITVGNDDERDAILSGSTVSSTERHRQRLSAASARDEFAEILESMVHSPTRSQIVGWLAQLSDEEVLNRFSSLKTTLDYDPRALLQTVEVLKLIHSEVLEFCQNATTG